MTDDPARAQGPRSVVTCAAVRSSTSPVVFATGSWVALVTMACGSATPSASSASDAPAAAPAEAPVQSAVSAGTSTPTEAPDTPSDAPSGLPTACADATAIACMPPSSFVDRLCAKPHQDTALALFDRSTPFTRGYVRGRLDELTLDEEVLLLRFHGTPKGGIVVGSGKGSYDLLRWDGTCSMAVEAEMVTRTRPGRPRTARVQWHRIATRTQDALLDASPTVKRARAKRGKECKGAMSGDVSAACEKADDALVGAVVDYVRSGGTLPPPDDLP